MEGHCADKAGTYLLWMRGSLDRLLGCHGHIGCCTTERRYMHKYLGLAGVVQHGPPMTLRSRGKLICNLTHLHTHARCTLAPCLVPWGSASPTRSLPRATIYAISPRSGLELNRATGTAPYPLSLLPPAPRLDCSLPQSVPVASSRSLRPVFSHSELLSRLLISRI